MFQPFAFPFTPSTTCLMSVPLNYRREPSVPCMYRFHVLPLPITPNYGFRSHTPFWQAFSDEHVYFAVVRFGSFCDVAPIMPTLLLLKQLFSRQ